MSINFSGLESLRVDKLLTQNSRSVEKNFERLSSGKRINHAKDDAAGLAVAVSLLSNASTRSVAVRNMSDSLSMADIADGALSQTSEITTRMSELAMQSANGVLSKEQRGALNSEYQSLKQELDRISETTEFNGQKLLDGKNSTTLQIGIDGTAASQLAMKMPGVSANSLGLPADISSQEHAQKALESSQKALEDIASARGEIGNTSNRVQVAIENALATEVSEKDAASRIMDADIAAESASLAANRIAQQASVAMKAQANVLPEVALRLLS